MTAGRGPAPVDPSEFEQRLNALKAEHDATYAPPGALVQQVTRAAWQTQVDLGSVLGYGVADEPSEPQMLQQFELLFLFRHLVLRTARTAGLTAVQTECLDRFVGAWLTSAAIDAFLQHWPRQMKAGVARDFAANRQVAEAEYSKCGEVIAIAASLSPTTVVGLFAHNVASIWNRDADVVLMSQAAGAVSRALQELPLRTLIEAVGPVIEAVDITVVEEYLTSRL